MRGVFVMKKIILLLAMTLLATGCAAEKIMWKNPSSNETQFKKDNFECVQASKTYGGGGGTGLIGLVMMSASMSAAQSTADRTYKMCMDSRGYIAQEK
jgi:Na+/proline symporter